MLSGPGLSWSRLIGHRLSWPRLFKPGLIEPGLIELRLIVPRLTWSRFSGPRFQKISDIHFGPCFQYHSFPQKAKYNRYGG